MEAKELRIGNYVLENSKNIKKVSSIIGDTIYTESAGKQFYTPIPITQEWKDKIKDNVFILIDSIGFVVFKNSYAYQFIFKDYPFIHQIQNLYFALTNEELTIK
jgi:hypothetical protein